MAERPYLELPEDLTIDAKFAQVVDPNGPPPAKAMAVKGVVLGATPAELLHVLYALTFDPNEQFATDAAAQLGNTPLKILTGAIGDETHAGVIDFAASK